MFCIMYIFHSNSAVQNFPVHFAPGYGPYRLYIVKILSVILAVQFGSFLFSKTDISSSSFHRLSMALVVAQMFSPNKENMTSFFSV